MREFAKWVGNQEDIRTVVEIGVATMINSLDLLEGCDRVIGVDPYKFYPPGHSYSGDVNNCESQAKQDIRYKAALERTLCSPRFTILRLTSLEASSLFDFKVDAVYLDADHSYAHVKQDIEIWRRRCRWIGGHDWGNERQHPGVMQAVNETFGTGKVTILGEVEWLIET